MSERYSALVEADAILTIDVPDDANPEEYILDAVNTGHLGPGSIKALEKDAIDDE